MSVPQHIWLVTGWLIFGILHSVFAGDAVKIPAQSFLGNKFKFYRLFYSVFAAINLGAVIYYQFAIASILLWQPFVAVEVIAVVTGLAGTIIMLTAIRKYFFSLSGVDVFFRKQAPVPLQINGLNAYMRHPLYTGTLLFVLGWFLWQPLLSNLISCTAVFLYTIIGTFLEEKRLLKIFGDEYKKYISRVPMFIPKIM